VPAASHLTLSEAAYACDVGCRAVGIDGTGAELLRLGHNAIYRTLKPPVVVRVARGADEWARARREVCVAAWLAEVGVPGARLWEGDVKQPVEALGRPVTFWDALTPSAKDGTAGDLGRLLRRLHEATDPPACDLVHFDPLTHVVARIDTAVDVPGPLRRVALRHCQLVTQAYERLEFALPPGVIHGDAYLGNVLQRGEEAVLIDFETFAVGPREWDLLPVAIARRRLGLPGREWDDFVDAYGFDVETWPGFDVLATIRELMMTTWLMQLVNDQPGVLPELETRIESIDKGNHDQQWRAF
jgi:aminoglycoside phosphotransferase